MPYRLYIPLLLIFALFSSFMRDKDPLTAEEILMRSQQALLEINTVSYELDFRTKALDRNDTSLIGGHVSLEKVREDSLMGCHFKSNTHLRSGGYTSQSETFYDGKKFLSLLSPANRAYSDNSEGKEFENPNYIKNNYKLHGLFPELYSITAFKKLLEGNPEITLLPGEKTGDRLCYKISLHFKEKNGINAYHCYLFIDRKTFLPLRKITTLEFENSIQYHDFSVFHVLTNEKSIKQQIVEPPIPPDYTIKALKKPDNRNYENPPLLSVGEVAPDFELQLLNSKETVKLSRLKGKACLLVFWYKGSYPFEAAAPYLDSLYLIHKYHGLQVYGVNALDAEKGNAELSEYLNKLNIYYPNGLDKEKNISNSYKVWEFPSVYLIGQDKKILFSHKGYDDGLPARLGKAIEAALK